jgi:hypothetical protein
MGTAFSIDDSPSTVTGIVAGELYSGRAWVQAGGPSTVGKTVMLVLREKNASGIQVGVSSTPVALTTSWKLATVNRTVATTGGTLEIYVYMDNASSGQAFHVDAFSLARGPAPSPQCTSTTCAAQGKNCGTLPDGCGGTLSCGSCLGAGETCGGGGQPNVCGTASPSPSPTPEPSGFTLMFQDDFNGTSVDSNSWNLYDGPGHAGNGLRKPSAFSVQNGILTITAQMLNGQIVSGGMSNKLNVLYGRFEARVRKERDPSGAMSGVFLTWPELQDRYKYGENDIWETGPTTGTDFHTYIHYGTQQYHYQHNADHTQWHVMAMEWSPSQIRIYRDGALVWTLSDTAAIPDWAHHACLQLDARKSTMGSTPVHMEVDWIKVYKRN